MCTPIEVEYMRSSFGMTLEELVMVPGPVRHTLLPAHRRSGDDSAADTALGLESAAEADKPDAHKLAVPKELWRLIDALWNGKALTEKDLFQGVSDEAEVAAIREALDTGVDFPAGCSPHAYVEAMTNFLASLAKPLIPSDLYPAVEVDEVTQKQLCKRFLDALPPLSYNVFVYVLSFLREVLAQSGYNRTSPASLASMCMQAMTAQPDGAGDGKEDSRRTMRINALRDLVVFLLRSSCV